MEGWEDEGGTEKKRDGREGEREGLKDLMIVVTDLPGAYRIKHSSSAIYISLAWFSIGVVCMGTAFS